MAAKLINKEFEDRQHNGQKKNDKRTSNDVQITTQRESADMKALCNFITKFMDILRLVPYQI
jgi:hypothetical protein